MKCFKTNLICENSELKKKIAQLFWLLEIAVK